VLPFDFVCACPEGFEPSAELIEAVGRSGVGTATISHDPIAAVKGADAIYGDVWVSMGQHLKGEKDDAYVPRSNSLQHRCVASLHHVREMDVVTGTGTSRRCSRWPRRTSASSCPSRSMPS
jgi:ornithine carbamoyltransferase